MKKKIFLLLFSIFLGLIIAEFALRLINFPPESNKAFQRKDISWMEKNVDLNSEGYRDKEYSQERVPNTFRIYALGDSYTYGWLVDNYQDTYPKILEKNLNQKGIKAEVINAGSPGFSLPEMVKRFSGEGKYYYPDLVVIGINDDEANFSKTYERTKDSQFNPFLKSLHLYQLTLGSYFRNVAEKINHQYVLDIYEKPDSKEWRDTTEKLLELKKEANEINAGLAIVLYPHIHPSSPNDPYDYFPYHEKFKQFGKENDVFIIDSLEDFQNYKEKAKLVINPLDPHPTADMNKIVAEGFIKQFSIEDFLKTHQTFTPESKTTTLTSDNLNLGEYQNIKKVSSNIESYPWVFFETKFGGDVQNFALKDKSSRNTKIYLDSLQTTKSFTHTAMPGATILYHIYPKEHGKILIPKNIYNYEVIGLNHIFAMEVLENGTTRGEYISPSEVIKNDQGINIRFYNDKDFHVFRINLKVAVRQLDINPDGKIESIAKTSLLKTIQDKKSKSISLPFAGQVTSWGEFSGEDTRAYSYAFVNGKMTKLKEVKTESDKVILNFDSPVEKGEEIEFPIMTNYQLEPEENIAVIYE